MTSDRYEEVECWACAGKGKSYDSTLADKVCSGGSGWARCLECRGTGTLQRRIPSPEFIAYRERERAALAALYTEVGEMPDWMLGD